MNKIEDISRLDKAIEDAEIRIKTVLSNITALSKEIDILSNKQKELEYNVKCLKKSRIIAIAQEFKKSKTELQNTKDRISILNNDKDRYVKSSEDLEKFIKKTKEELDKLKDINDNNVLQFNRGAKDGQK